MSTINTALSTRLAADLVARTLRLNALYAGGRAPVALPRALPARLGISPQYARTRARASGQYQKHRIGPTFNGVAEGTTMVPKPMSLTSLGGAKSYLPAYDASVAARAGRATVDK